MKPPLGQQLRALRLEKGLSTRAMGRAIGRSHSTISQVENGERSTTTDVLHEWATALGAEVSVGRTVEGDAEDLASQVSALQPADAAVLEAVLKALPKMLDRERAALLAQMATYELY